MARSTSSTAEHRSGDRRRGTALDDQRITQDSPGVPGNAEREDRFGAVTAFGDFNDDGCADLAVSSPGENGAGSVNVLYGSPTGLSTSGVQGFSGAIFGPDPDGADLRVGAGRRRPGR